MTDVTKQKYLDGDSFSGEEFTTLWQLLCLEEEKNLKTKIIYPTEALTEIQLRELIGGWKLLERLKTAPERFRKSISKG